MLLLVQSNHSLINMVGKSSAIILIGLMLKALNYNQELILKISMGLANNVKRMQQWNIITLIKKILQLVV